MKVRMTVIVDIDPKKWRDEYGEPQETAKQIRELTKGDIYQAVEDNYRSFRAEDGGFFNGVEVK